MSGKTASFWLKTAEATLALLAVLVPLGFLLHSYDAASLKATLFEAGALVLCGCWLLKGLARGRWEVPAEAMPLLLPAVLLFAWIGARLAASPAPLAALPGALGQLLGLLVFAVTLLECGGAGPARRFSSALLAAGWADGLYAAAQRLGLDPLSWKGAFGVRPFATLGSPAGLGLFAAACAPIALSRLAEPERETVFKAADAALLALLGAAAAGSLEGMAAFAAAGLVSAAALPAFLPSRSSGRAALGGLALCALAVAGGFTLQRGVPTADPSAPPLWRRSLSDAAGTLMGERPLLGAGPGALALRLDETPAARAAGARGARPAHVPGLLIERMCELGIPAGLVWLWLFCAVLAASWKARRRFIQRAALEEAGALAGLTSSLMALLIVGQWSVTINETAAGWLLWPLAGLCGGLSLLAGRGPVSVLPLPLSASRRRAASAAVLPALIAVLLVPAWWQAADVRLNAAAAAAERGDYGEAARLAQAADVPGAPNMLEARYVAGQALLAAGRPQDALATLGRLEEAAPAFGRLQQLKGRAYMRLGEWGLAQAALERQRALDPASVPTLELLAAAAKEAGDFAAARQAALTAISLDPSDPLPKVTLSEVFAREKKAAAESDRRERVRRPRPPRRPRNG